MISMTPASERACRRILVPPPAQERPHRWHSSPSSINATGSYYSNSGDHVQYKGQVWRRDDGWHACLRLHQPVGLFGSEAAARAYVEEKVARLSADAFNWHPSEDG